MVVSEKKARDPTGNQPTKRAHAHAHAHTPGLFCRLCPSPGDFAAEFFVGRLERRGKEGDAGFGGWSLCLQVPPVEKIKIKSSWE